MRVDWLHIKVAIYHLVQIECLDKCKGPLSVDFDENLQPMSQHNEANAFSLIDPRLFLRVHPILEAIIH